MNSSENFYTMYTGISRSAWEKIWKTKNILNAETNITSDINFAEDYSYDFKTGLYDNTVCEIGNIPIEAFIASA